ncbi:hypothetical protein ACS0TY_032691 [Phlomoides rotata]
MCFRWWARGGKCAATVGVWLRQGLERVENQIVSPLVELVGLAHITVPASLIATSVEKNSSGGAREDWRFNDLRKQYGKHWWWVSFFVVYVSQQLI